GYCFCLDWSLRHRGTLLAASALVTGGSVWLYLDLPKAFMPTQDTGVMLVRIVAPSSISFGAMEECQRAVGEALLEDPAVAALNSYISDSPRSVGQMIVALKPLESGRPPIERVIERLRDRAGTINGVRTVFVP
ncbi:efflux RND transporter permease subunit, partial [Escherichia coli]|nr:efflux RND transporter permease subunit [Escherichia coli]